MCVIPKNARPFFGHLMMVLRTTNLWFVWPPIGSFPCGWFLLFLKYGSKDWPSPSKDRYLGIGFTDRTVADIRQDGAIQDG